MPGSQPEETGGNLALLARLDTSTVSGYVLYVDDGGDLGLQISQGGQLTDIVPNVDLGINAATDIIIELNIIGTDLFGYAWLPGESKPAEPQIAAFDNAFSMGKAGIAYDEDDDNTTGVFRWAMAQDTPFVDALAGDFNTDGKVDAADYVNGATDWEIHLRLKITISGRRTSEPAGRGHRQRRGCERPGADGRFADAAGDCRPGSGHYVSRRREGL